MNRTGALPRISRAAFIIAAFAFLVRLGFVTAHERPLFSDEIDYDRLGSTLATTGEHSDDGRPTAYRPIGYPALIAGMYAVAGRCPWAVHVAQAALGSLSAILLWLQPVEAACSALDDPSGVIRGGEGRWRNRERAPVHRRRASPVSSERFREARALLRQ